MDAATGSGHNQQESTTSVTTNPNLQIRTEPTESLTPKSAQRLKFAVYVLIVLSISQSLINVLFNLGLSIPWGAIVLGIFQFGLFRKGLRVFYFLIVIWLVLNVLPSFGFIAFLFNQSIYSNFTFGIWVLFALQFITGLLSMVSLYYAFKKTTRDWIFTAINQNGQVSSTIHTWKNVIPTINYISIIISILLVFGLDLIILLMSPQLFMFWAVMLVIFAVSFPFYIYERNTLKKRFASTNSRLDMVFELLVIVRNIVFVMCFIPVIQIGGTMALVVGIIPYLIIYFVLVSKRSKQVASAPIS